MTSYTITANGTTMGTYEGATRDEAILAYVRDAGYASVEEAAEALSQTREQFLADIDVSEDRTMTTIKVMTVGASKMVETPGAVDATVEVNGIAYGVTLCPRQSDGVLDMWGDIDHWISGQRDPRTLDGDTLDDIVATVRQAARS